MGKVQTLSNKGFPLHQGKEKNALPWLPPEIKGVAQALKLDSRTTTFTDGNRTSG